MAKFRLAIVTSHPIQYQCPLFRRLARVPELDLMVYFCCDHGMRATKDEQFGTIFKWDIPLLEGFPYKLLSNWAVRPGPRPWGCINPAILKELRRGGYDAVMVFGWGYPTQWFAFVSSTPVILMSESPLCQELLKPLWKQRLKRMVLRRLFRRLAAFLYIGAENRDFYRHYGVPDDRLFFCPYAVDNDRFIAAYEAWKDRKDELKAEAGISPDHVVILFSGKLIEKKRPLDLLRAFQKMNDPKAALVYVGDGELRETLEGEARAHGLTGVHLVGFQNQTEIPRFYAMADVFVLPSVVGETWGLVVNEAMCFHLPIVVSDLPGSGRDLVQHGENGYVFKARDVDGLATYLSSLTQNRPLREQMGRVSGRIISQWGYDQDVQGVLKAVHKATTAGAGRTGF